MMDDYAILGINRAATEAEIKAAFRRLAKKFHPDSGGRDGNASKFREVHAAYQRILRGEPRTFQQEDARARNGESSNFRSSRGHRAGRSSPFGFEFKPNFEDIFQHRGSFFSDIPDPDDPGTEKHRCLECDGYGFNTVLGAGWECRYCSGKGYIQRKF